MFFCAVDDSGEARAIALDIISKASHKAYICTLATFVYK